MPLSAWAEDEAPSYTRDVEPILQNHYVRCHRPGRLKGKVDVSSVPALLKGGKRGKVILAPGKPQKSPLVLTMEGHRPIMPPQGAPAADGEGDGRDPCLDRRRREG